jgi:hypothetical protein
MEATPEIGCGLLMAALATAFGASRRMLHAVAARTTQTPVHAPGKLLLDSRGDASYAMTSAYWLRFGPSLEEQKHCHEEGYSRASGYSHHNLLIPHGVPWMNREGS